MYGIYLIVVLVLMGGVIAYIGDRLGTKIGKKRLSIFGLRPRHTSMIITIFTGICTTILTFGILAAVSEDVRTALFGMEALTRSVESTQRDLKKAVADLMIAQNAGEVAQKELDVSKRDIAELEKKQKELEEEAFHLEEGNRALAEEKDELTAKNDALNSENESLSGRNQTLSTENEKLFADNQNLSERADALRRGMMYIREGDIAFRAGEVLASGIIPAGRSKEETAAAFARIAREANNVVQERLGGESDEKIWIYQPAYEKALDEVSSGQGDMVLRITAAGNLVRGEAVHTDLNLYPNSQVYKKGQLIYAGNYEAQGGEQNAEHTLVVFLKDVNAEAVSQGLLANPLTGSVGIMNGEQIYQIIDALTPVRGIVRLSAFAESETDVLGPLRIAVKVELVN